MSDQLTFTFPWPLDPWSTNQERTMSWQTLYRHVSTWRDATMWHTRSILGGTTHIPTPAHIKVVISFPVKRRRDPHNYAGTVVKAIVDGLVNAGMFPDDTAEYVRVDEPELEVNKGSGYVTVTITPDDREKGE